MKWLENSTSIAAAVEKWDKTPVDVVPIDTAGVAACVKTAPASCASVQRAARLQANGADGKISGARRLLPAE